MIEKKNTGTFIDGSKGRESLRRSPLRILLIRWCIWMRAEIYLWTYYCCDVDSNIDIGNRALGFDCLHSTLPGIQHHLPKWMFSSWDSPGDLFKMKYLLRRQNNFKETYIFMYLLFWTPLSTSMRVFFDLQICLARTKNLKTENTTFIQ